MAHDNDQKEDLFISIPMEINPEQMKMTAILKEESFSITIKIEGPFTEAQLVSARGLCKTINNVKPTGKAKIYN